MGVLGAIDEFATIEEFAIDVLPAGLIFCNFLFGKFDIPIASSIKGNALRIKEE
ncbi:MAG: hypothetical protein ACAH10_04835 [Methylophilaceae bacterium]